MQSTDDLLLIQSVGKELVLHEEIKELLERSPFEPFVIVTSWGDKYCIEDRHSVALMRKRLFVATKNEKWAFVPYHQILSLEAAPKVA